MSAIERLPSQGKISLSKTEPPNECPVRENFDPLSADFLTDPFAVLATLPLEETPVFYAPTLG